MTPARETGNSPCHMSHSYHMHSTFISKSNSNTSSLFLSCVPHPPTPSNNAASSSGTDQLNDSGLRRALNTNTSSFPLALMRSQLLSPARVRTRTGANVNQSPKALQKGVSIVSERILYEITIWRSATASPGVVRCSSVRSNGANNSGKYTCPTSHTKLGGGKRPLTHQIAANYTRDRRETKISLQCLCVRSAAPC